MRYFSKLRKSYRLELPKTGIKDLYTTLQVHHHIQSFSAWSLLYQESFRGVLHCLPRTSSQARLAPDWIHILHLKDFKLLEGLTQVANISDSLKAFASSLNGEAK
jgi:hypothetical protein